MIHFLMPRDEDYTVREYLGFWGRGVAGEMAILHYEDLPARTELPGGTWILTAVDHLTPEGRRVVADLCDQRARSGAGARTLNSPLTTLRRLELLEELQRRGLNNHRAVRAEGDLAGLEFPVFLREERWHTGALTPLLRTPAELEAALARAIVRAHRLSELLVVEFTDTSDAQGFFRKYAAFIVGREIIPRSLAHGRAWMLKFGGSEFTAAMVHEERDYVFENPHERELRAIFEVARVEYGRIDYAVKDGAIQTWEINSNPTIGRGQGAGTRVIPPELQPFRQAAKERFYERFRAAFEAVDSGGRTPAPISVRDSPENLRQSVTMTEVERKGGRFPALRKALRPIRPLLDRIAGVASPILVKAARLVR
jgi:hypothetical protein